DYPVSFWNENAKEYQGIAVDLIRETERITGMRFVFVEEDNGDDEEILLSGVADALGGVIRNESLEGRLTFAEKPYKTDYYAFVSLSGFRDITLSDVPYLNVGLLSGAAYEETFYSMFPNHKNVAVFADRHAAETALERGGIDVLLGTRDILLDITNYHEQTGYRENLVLTRPYEVYFAFAPGDDGATLSWIMSRALDHIDAEMTVDGWTRRVFDYSGALAKAQRPFLFAVVALMTVLLIAGIVLIIRARASAARLDRLVSIRTTELRNRTQELEIQTEAADAASVAKSDFLARMSHEIRTPLNAVIGMTEVAHRAETIEKKNSSLLEIEAASHHLLGILNDVLDMAKIESGKFQLSDADFLLRTALVEVQHIIEQRCAEKRITLAVNFADLTDYGVVGDKLRLKQVLINLLGNAVKFTPEDGGIRFFADVSEAEESVRVRFSVTDTGIGISEEQIGKLFNAFEQANETISVRFGGTGLGLSISQNLVRQMGGLIEVTSTLGEGSTFAFELEMPRALHLEQQGEAAPESAHDFTGKRILLAEDIEINRLILRELLSDTHVGIDEAEDGAQALEMFRAAPAGYYQTILMDVQMPNMNGHEATRAIRALAPERPDAAAVPIIALTANAYKEDIDRALASGMNGHLAKPIDIKEVVAMLERQLLPGN
ncbi:MAG: response regulator, partial [Oscillospiraceae bacterium]|nr:response regulator [Oscillospiraceae bacterium]